METAELISGTIEFLIVDILRLCSSNFQIGRSDGSW